MIWNGAADFFHMGGYGLYVWGSLAATGLAIALEITALRWRTARLAREVRWRSALGTRAAARGEPGPEEHGQGDRGHGGRGQGAAA